jgi:predicted ATP-dependent endonuclease of OLD family
MKVTNAHIKNFRLLQNVDVAFDEDTTIIVGRNNSGKTSLVEIFRKFFGPDRGRFNFDDLSLSTHASLATALGYYDAAETARASKDFDAVAEFEALYRAEVPAIELELTVIYKDSDELTALSPFIMDLDPTRNDATVVCLFEMEAPQKLFQEYRAANDKTAIDLTMFIRRQFRRYFRARFEAIDNANPTNRRTVSETELQALMVVNYIYAQNQFDDLSSDTNHGLSKGFESFYKANQDDNNVVDDIAELLATVATDLDLKSQDLFKAIFDDLKVFGIGRMGQLPELSVVSEFEAIKLIAGNAHLYYTDSGSGERLPEAHNGLGYSRLIFTILQFIAFYEELQRLVPKPPIQLVFVEEPEAHLHPQMQYVFIKNIAKFVQSKADWNAQTVVTTHSSHIVAESGFSCIRYFDNSVVPLKVRDLSDFEKKENASDPEVIKFLRKYMVLARCDLFFADKAILVEGTVERLLLPQMIIEVAEDLLHQYVSVIEVGGAYAHLFRGMLEFLNVQTLIITDIDSVDPADARKAAKVASGLKTSNQTLVKWIPALGTIDELLAATPAQKIDRRVAVAFQVPEVAGGSTGRSFEEAFILANASALATSTATLSADPLLTNGTTRLTAPEIQSQSYEIAGGIKKKTDFAFDILTLDAWTTPRYIKEGLEWLNTTP